MHDTQTPKIPKTFTCKQNYVLVDVYELIYYNGSRRLTITYESVPHGHIGKAFTKKSLISIFMM